MTKKKIVPKRISRSKKKDPLGNNTPKRVSSVYYPPSPKSGEFVTLDFPPKPQELLSVAMDQLTRDFDLDEYFKHHNEILNNADNADDADNANMITVSIVDMNYAFIPMTEAYGFFHERISTAICDGLLDDFYTANTDEDRVSIAEQYVTEVLRLTDIEDAAYFRKGVWRRELAGEMYYGKQRDHAAHTLNNYLLGWYFFVNCPRLTSSFQEVLSRRNSEHSQYMGSLIRSFGNVWCFVSLLHDIGYIFDGELHPEQIDTVDSRILRGANYAKRYFTDVFWKDLGIRSVDLKEAATDIANLEPDMGKLTLDSPETIVDFLRGIGPLDSMEKAIQNELSEDFENKLPADGLNLWAMHFEEFGQIDMAERIRGLETALDSLIEDGIPGIGVRNLDHGICGGLLLLKYSTIWFRLIFSCKNANPASDTNQEAVCRRLQKLTKNWAGYDAKHWWRNILWATGAVAIHNIQQSPSISGWYSKLDYCEAPLAYLGVLVDILQEWDRPSSQRTNTIETSDLRINSGDVTIGVLKDHRVKITYGCRDGSARRRGSKIRKDLDLALSNWRDIVDVSFKNL